MADVEASGIRGEKYEHVNVYNKAGERVAQFGDDNEKKIEVTRERFEKLNGNAYVHNHPAGGPTSFSPGDLQVGKQADASMMGAVTPRGTTFLLHRPKEGWPNYMGDDFNVAANKVATELINERKAGRISKADMNLVISDIANVAMAHANDLDYERNYGPEDQKLVDRYKHLYAQAESGSLLPTMPKALRTSEGAKKAWLSRKRRQITAAVIKDAEAQGLREGGHERASIYTAAGEHKGTFGDGDADAVNITPPRARMIAGSIIVHNHPISTPLSGGDLAVAARAKAVQVTAIGKNGSNFTMYPRPNGTWPDTSTVANVHSNHGDAARRQLQELRVREGRHYTDKQSEFLEMDIANHRLARDTGMTYEPTYATWQKKLVADNRNLYDAPEPTRPWSTLSIEERTSEGAKKAWLSRKRGWDGEDIHDLGERTAKFYEGLTSEEKTGIFNYTAGAMEFNALLRTGQPKFGHDEEYIAQVKRDIPEIKKAIQKYELPEDTNAYRVFYGDMGKNLTAGQSWKDDGFVSTSASEALAKDFGGGSGTVAQLRIKAGTHAAPINGKSSHPGEQELLLDGGHTYTVTSMSDPDEQGIRYATIDVS